MSSSENNTPISSKDFLDYSPSDKYRVKCRQRDRLINVLDNLKKEDFEVMCHAELEVKLDFLENKNSLFEQLQTDLEFMNENEFDQNNRDKFESVYCCIKSRIIHNLSMLRSSTMPLNSTQIPHQHSSSHVNLPKLQLSKFGGQYKQWLDFYNMFSVLVDKNDSLSNVEKFQYLRSCLEEDAAQLVQALEVTEKNYANALELLTSRYGNKRYIFNAHLNEIFNIEKLTNPNVSQLRNFVDTINANLRAIQSFATKLQIADGILLHLVISKFDLQTKTKWEDEIANRIGNSSTKLSLPEWDTLAAFLEKMCQTMEIIATDKPTATKMLLSQRKPVSFVVSENINCNLCEQPDIHNPFKCSKFIKLDPMGRYDLVKRKRLCLNCLAPHHISSNCPSSNRCQECKVSHHTLLHRDKPKPNDDDHCSTPTVLHVSHASEVIIATALIEMSTPSGKKLIGRALLDSASQLHFVTERVAQFLHLSRHKINVDISGVGSSSVKAYFQCGIAIKSLQYAYQSNIEAIVLPSITGSQPHRLMDISKWNIPANIKLADPKFNVPGPIDMLLGTGAFYELLMVGQIKLRENLPILQKTSFGWIVAGGITKSPSLSSSSPPKNTVLTANISNIDQLVEQFWILEDKSSDNKCEQSIEEQECEQYFDNTTTRCPATGKFIVRLSFKSSYEKLGQSYDIAYKRFLLLEKRLQQQNDLKIEYTKFINEYIQLGHMKLLQNHPSLNYIPHHCVTKMDSSSTKLRVVFDASCKTTSGVALNDILRTGPKLQDDLFTILFRFRFHKIVLMADITKMYRQVLVHPDDRKWQCILWRSSSDAEVMAYQLQTVTYGTSCASYLAIKCLQQLATENSTQFPIGSEVVLNDFYVDNLMTGAASIEEVIEIKKQVTELLETGGFPLRKFASNVSKVLDDVSLSDREQIVQLYDYEFIKALGLKWSPTQDKLLFHYELPKPSSKLTKRKILSHIATFFDPLGIINPIIVTCKILMQSLWKLKINWDESVPQLIATQWQNICDQLPHINKIQIPRLVTLDDKFQIHAFADASKKAYGTCIYATAKQNGETISMFLCAKSRVAPTKEVTLPRLELCANLLLTELLEIVCAILKPNPQNVHCWSDSSIALAWINGDASRWTQFVANRVRKIQLGTSQYTWHHCPTAENPADLVSRGTNVLNLVDNQMWFGGPAFLKKDESLWPSLQCANQGEILEEERYCNNTLLIVESPSIFENLKYINSYKRVIRIFVYVKRFIDICLKRTNIQRGSITVEEEKKSLLSICVAVQRECFPVEYKALSKPNARVHVTSKLNQLSPFMDNTLIRVGGRLQNSSLPLVTIHPILLPSKHPFVYALIEYYHRLHMHAGSQTLASLLRDQFWIMNSRDTVRRIVHKCIICYRCRPKITEQIMGQLPSDRLEPTYPFAVSGVDYCGPFLVTQRLRGKPTTKVYVAVFICFTTKAIHIELATDLSTNAFISVLKRFIARRGKCHTIYSDNATNFVGANRELKELLSHFISTSHIDNVETFCRQEGMQWKFIPPRSPHFGGLWESAVKQTKYVLRRSLGSFLFTYDELQTVCCQAEAIVNSRPLTPMSSDPDDIRALTPSHFLISRTAHTVPEPTIVDEKIGVLKRYQQIQWVQQSFWRRWQSDYVTQLQTKSKWTKEHNNLQINDLVLIKEENLPPLKWKMGRIIEAIEAPDGKVRVVVLKTAEGQQKRAITRVCKIPVETN